MLPHFRSLKFKILIKMKGYLFFMVKKKIEKNPEISYLNDKFKFWSVLFFSY